MSRYRAALPRRAVLRGGLRAGAGAVLLPAVLGATALGSTACTARLAGTRLTVGTGGSQGVYFALGTALAQGWQHSLGLTGPPSVRTTAGSVDNLALLAGGAVDVVFSAADVADDQLRRPTTQGRELRALARIYDDALQVVVPAGSPITRVTDLRGRRVSIGATDSGVIVMAHRLLEVAGLAPSELTASTLGIDESVAALRAGHIDAFFWSGAITTKGVADLAAVEPIRLLDLAPQKDALRARYPVYDMRTVPAGTYRIGSAISTLFVRNFLLVTAAMSDDLAGALVAGLFEAADLLIRANAAGRAIDARSAIGTQPVPLHPGALRYYRDTKAFD